MKGTSRPPRLLTIAGSDSGGGAGIQADLKTFAAHGVYGASVVTAVTAQNTVSVTAIELVSPRLIAAQIDAVLADIDVDVVKIGMVGDSATIAVIADRLVAHRNLPVVVDPVMVATGGAELLGPESVGELGQRLLPLAVLVTPNVPEAERLSGLTIDDESGQIAAARAIAARGPAVLVKGGHLAGDEVVDILWVDGEAVRFAHRRIDSSSTHGTGCTLSAAIAARLAMGERISDAVGGAIEYLHGAIAAAYPVGRGHGPVDPLYRLFPR
ncbi:MAG TPA: bifunctional hydroxymethylpyrimidine kinase/phosphomethylpyrimidine kinase [Thermoanaerobaculia bacterium]|nr:bifunctional hydroxymethylpyrimidine kinase/phosphomethylpyrimidine kinase [Thermoanaerobaculia bacterium]